MSAKILTAQTRISRPNVNALTGGIESPGRQEDGHPGRRGHLGGRSARRSSWDCGDGASVGNQLAEAGRVSGACLRFAGAPTARVVHRHTPSETTGPVWFYDHGLHRGLGKAARVAALCPL